MLEQIKTAQTNALAQVQYLHKELVAGNLAVPKANFKATQLQHWQAAQLRNRMVAWLTIPFVVSECFWTTWLEVYRAVETVPNSKEQ